MDDWRLKHYMKLTGVLILLFLIVMIPVVLLSPGGPTSVWASADYSAVPYFKDLSLQAKSVVVYDVTKGKIIFGRNETTQLPLASLTKIMSATIAAEKLPSDSIIDFKGQPIEDPQPIINAPWHLSDFLKLSLTASSNSGMIAAAGVVSSQNGGKSFTEMMNTKAKELGLSQTYFSNESGLDMSDGVSGGYGSASDVARLLSYAAINHPDIFGATKESSFTATSLRYDKQTVNNTNSITQNLTGLVASKTGYTTLAGGNLAIILDVPAGPRPGEASRRIAVVVLGSTQDGRFTDVQKVAEAVSKYFNNK